MTKKTRSYKSEAMAAIHETAIGLFETGAINKKTIREFDALCLTPIRTFTPEEIRTIRQRENVSQSVFANYLNVSKGSVSQWEQGKKRPTGASLKLLSLVEKKGLRAIC